MTKLHRDNATPPVSAGKLFFLSAVITLLFAMTIWFSGFAVVMDEQLRIYRERFSERAPTGKIHIAAIDSASIAALNKWPWPRETHAALVDRLRAAGATTIAFDIDFSAPSTQSGDIAFATALESAGSGVILPTFRQRGDNQKLFENLPIAPLRQHAVLASVNVTPDPDGIMRSFAYGIVTDGVVRPAMPAMLAGVAGKVGGSFPVNTSISPASLPMHSVSDILSGKIGRETLAGKTVLIGATAIELGDRYAMPRYGVQPGVVIQALATETLLQNLVVPNHGAMIPVAMAVMILAAIARLRQHSIVFAVMGMALIAGLPLALEQLAFVTVDVAAALCGYAAGAITLLGIRAVAQFDQARLIDAALGLPNEIALQRELKKVESGQLVVMRIRNFDDVADLMSDDQRTKLLDHVCDRIAFATGSARQFSLGQGRIAWIDENDDIDRLTDCLDGLATLFGSRITIGGQKVMIAPAFGIAVGADRANPVHANLAASRAAALGSRWVIYSAELGSVTERAQQLLADLDDAMVANDISLVYQPKLTLATGRIDGVEALVRWKHPLLGQIPPDQFIPILEEAGRMAELTLFLAEQCIGKIRDWHASDLHAGIAVNISAPLLSDAAFVTSLFAIVDEMGPLASHLTLEITESAVVLNDKTTIGTLSMFRGAGVRIAIDDYGTGQSTLSYIQKFRADEIKIDQSFIRNLVDETSDQILVRSTIAMAHEMGFKVVAEGVEDAACCEVLRRFGCDVVQGWHIGKGVAAPEIEAILRDGCEATAPKPSRASKDEAEAEHEHYGLRKVA